MKYYTDSKRKEPLIKYKAGRLIGFLTSCIETVLQNALLKEKLERKIEMAERQLLDDF